MRNQYFITYPMVLQSLKGNKCFLYCFLINFNDIHITINSIFYVILHHHTRFDLTPKNTGPMQLICRYLEIVGREKRHEEQDTRQVTGSIRYINILLITVQLIVFISQLFTHFIVFP